MLSSAFAYLNRTILHCFASSRRRLHNTRLTLLQILEDRYDKASTIVVSQLPIDQWYDYLGEPATIADAIMDRLVSNVNRIELKGESLRRKKGK